MTAYRGSALTQQKVAAKLLSTKKLRALVFARANGLCECGCERALGDSGHLDHFFGRAKAPATVENCWALSLACDDAKTNNKPSAVMWCDRFYLHSILHGHHEAAERAAARAQSLATKGFAS